jgi:hypothetical protein
MEAVHTPLERLVTLDKSGFFATLEIISHSFVPQLSVRSITEIQNGGKKGRGTIITGKGSLHNTRNPSWIQIRQYGLQLYMV